MKKKIFLGAYLNYTNAQNLNCLSLARHLDKEKFDIHALTTQFGDNNIEDISIKLFHCFSPFVFTKYIGFIWGILNCEILYLPKHREMPVWVLKFANLLTMTLLVPDREYAKLMISNSLVFLNGLLVKNQNILQQ